MYGLTAMVSRSLEVTEVEAKTIIDEQADLGRDMLDSSLNHFEYHV